MRLVQVVSDRDRRGAQVFAVELAPILAAAGHQVSTVSLVPGGTDAGLDVDALTSSSRWPQALPALRRRTGDADLVLAHGSSSLPAVALASAAPYVYRSIGDLPRWVSGRLRPRWVGAMLRRACGVSVLWSGLVPFVTDRLGVDPGRVAVIPNAVDAARFPAQDGDDRAAARHALGLHPTDPVVAHVGALASEKQVGQLVEAVAGIGAQLVLAGDGPDRADAARAAEAQGVRASFLGPVADPRPVYAAADVVALASATEGQPAVLIEAALCARAVVAPRVGGVPELVADGTTGVLYEGGSAELAEALGQAVDRADALGAAAREPALAHDIAVVGGQWVRWLEQLDVAQAQ